MTAAAPSAPAQQSSRPSWSKTWFLAVRPFSFTTSTVPVLAASALALFAGDMNPARLVLMLVASMATHAGCNLANDFYDDESGVDRVQAVGTGGVLQRGWLTRRDIGIGIAASFAIALVAALPIMVEIGRPIVVLAILSAGAAFFYTGGPFPLAYWALGEITVFLAMGVGMVAGTYYVHTGDLSSSSLLLGTAIGLLSAAILHANNIRDRDIDRAHRKRTVANLTSRRTANREYQGLVLLGLLAVPVLVVIEPGSWPILITLLVLPKVRYLLRLVVEGGSIQDFNRLLRQSAGLHLQFGILVTVGYLAATVIGYL